MNPFTQLLQQHYGLKVQNVSQRDGGWSALAYQVETETGTFFLKMYEKSRASTPKWTSMIDLYVPLLLHLDRHSSLQGMLPVPLLTVDGRNKCENEDGIFLLYEHIEGETIGEKPLSDGQKIQLADILSVIHTYDETSVRNALQSDLEPIREDFDLPFLPSLRAALNEQIASHAEDMSEIRNILSRFRQPLIDLMVSVHDLSLRLRQRPLRYALCHTDLHHWNLMSSSNGQLILIDWEGVRLAPVEADWMFLVDKPYYEDVLAQYRKHHPNFIPDPEPLSFYEGRRRLEDIWEFIEQLLFDTQDKEERAQIQGSLINELEQLPSKPR